MADVNIKAKISVDAEDAKKGMDDFQKNTKKASAGLNDAQKEAKKSGESFISLSGALKGLGVMSAVEGAFGIFKETLGKNQKVADLMTTSMNFLSKAFNDLFAFIEKNIGPAIDYMKGLFENPKQAIADFGEMIKNNLIERFRSLLDMFGYVGSALKNLFTGDWDAAMEAAKNAGKELLDVTTGISNTAGLIEKGVNAIVDYSKETWKAAEAQTQLQNNAKLAEARLAGLVEKYDRLAEQQRQLRDDETNSIEERIKANNKLGDVLKDQAKAMLALANQKIASAQADLNANRGNIDMQVALTNAINGRQAILAQITGLESEQKVNAVSLAKEQLEMNKAIAESDNKIALDKKKASVELINDEWRKLQETKKIRDEERKIELARLQENIDNTKLGTQARIDAQIAYNEKKAELDIADMQYIVQVADLNKKSLVEEQALLDAKLSAQMQYANAIGSIFGQLAGLFGQGTAASKAAAIAEIGIGTATGYIQGLDIAQKASKATGPAAAFAFPIFYATQIAAVLGAAAKAKQVLSQVKGGGSASTSSAAAPSISSSAPVLPNMTANAIQLNAASIQGIGNAAAGGVNRAFVLEADINNSGERQARLQRAARLG